MFAHSLNRRSCCSCSEAGSREIVWRLASEDPSVAIQLAHTEEPLVAAAVEIVLAGEAEGLCGEMSVRHFEVSPSLS